VWAGEWASAPIADSWSLNETMLKQSLHKQTNLSVFSANELLISIGNRKQGGNNKSQDDEFYVQRTRIEELWAVNHMGAMLGTGWYRCTPSQDFCRGQARTILSRILVTGWLNPFSYVLRTMPDPVCLIFQGFVLCMHVSKVLLSVSCDRIS